MSDTIPRIPSPGRTAGRIAALYAAVATLWVYGTDRMLAGAVTDPASLTHFQTWKGWLFVAGTTVLLYFLVRRTLAAYRAATRQLHQLSRAVEQSPSLILITDVNGDITYVNPAFTAVTGYAPEEVIGENPRLLKSGEQPDEVYAELWRTITAGQEWRGEFHNKKKDGSLYWAAATITPILDEEGRITHYLGEQEDISLRREYETRLETLAQYDPLTGLPNRNLLADRLEQALAHAERHRQQVAVLFLDIDHFKRVNDEFGHDVGDQVLKGFAGRLEECVRKSDTVARLGGDEFIILLAEVADAENAATVARKIIGGLQTPLPLPERELSVATSIGIALYPADGTDGETLIKRADMALYQAKQEGRNRYRFFVEGQR